MAGTALIWDLIARDNASPTFNRVAASAERTSVATGGMMASMSKTAGVLGLAVVAFEGFKGAISIAKQATAYQAQMTQIQTLTGASAAEVKNMSTALLGMAGKVAQAPEALALSLYHVESVGLRGAAALNAVAVAAKAAGIGNASLEDTTNALTSTVASGITHNQSYAKTMSQLLTIVGSGDMKLSDFNDALSTGGLNMMANYGLSLKDVGAALAVFGDQNIRGAAAMTGLRMAVQGMAVPAKSAGAMLDALGLTTTSLAEDMQKGGLLLALTDLNTRIHAAGLSGNKLGATLTELFGKRSGSGLSTLLSKMNDSVGNVLSKYAAMNDATQSLGSRWSTFTQTASFQFKSLGASIDAAGITLIRNLTPALGTVATVLTGAVKTALDVISGAMKPFAAAWSAVSGILGPTGSALSGIGHFLAPLGGALKDVGAAALAMWIAFKGYGILTAVGAMLGNFVYSAAFKASTGLETLGATFGLTAVEAEVSALGIAGSAETASAAVVASGDAARIGWAGIAGPIALAVVGVVSMIGMFHKSTSASKEATDAAKAYGDAVHSASKSSITDTIISQLSDNHVPELLAAMNDALGRTAASANQFVTAISQGGKPLETLRANLQHVIDAAPSMVAPQAVAAAKALSVLNTEYGALGDAQVKELAQLKAFGSAAAPIQKVATVLNVSAGAAKQYATMAGLAVTANDNVIGPADKTKAAIKGIADAYASATTTGAAFLAALNTFSTSAGNAADRASLIGSTLVAANGDALSYASSMNAASSASKTFAANIQTAAKAIGKSGVSTKAYLGSVLNLKKGTIDYRKSAAGPLISDLQGMQSAAMAAAQATYQHARATMTGKEAATQAYQVYRSQTSGQLIDEAVKLGLTHDQAQKLSDTYFGMPKSVKTLIQQEGADPILTVLNKIGAMLAHLTGQPWGVAVRLDAPSVLSTIGQITGALLGIPALTVATVVTKAVSSGKQPYTGPGHATGGSIHGAGTGTSDSIPSMLSTGEYVIKASQAAKYRPLLDAINRGAPEGFASGGSVGAHRRHEAALDDWQGGHPITHTGTGKSELWVYDNARYSTWKKAQSAQATAMTDAAAAIKAAAQKIRQAVGNLPGDIRSFLSGRGSVSSSSSAFRAMLKDVTDAGGTGTFVKDLKKDDAALNDAIRKRIADAAKLAKAQAALAKASQQLHQEISTVSGATRAGFDITQAGQNSSGKVAFGALRASQSQELTLIHKWAADLRKLNKVFGKSAAGRAMLRQLAEAGPSSYNTVAALAQAGPRALQGIVSTEQAIDRAAGSIGQFIGQGSYGTTFRQDKRAVAQDKRQVARDKRRDEHLAVMIGREVNQALGSGNFTLNINSRGLARIVRTGGNQNRARGG